MRFNTLFKSQQLIFLVASLFFGLLTLWIFGDLASPILISIVLAVLFRPVNTYFTKICIPRNPKCNICGINKICKSYKKNLQHFIF